MQAALLDVLQRAQTASGWRTVELSLPSPAPSVSCGGSRRPPRDRPRFVALHGDMVRVEGFNKVAASNSAAPTSPGPALSVDVESQASGKQRVVDEANNLGRSAAVEAVAAPMAKADLLPSATRFVLPRDDKHDASFSPVIRHTRIELSAGGSGSARIASLTAAAAAAAAALSLRVARQRLLRLMPQGARSSSSGGARRATSAARLCGQLDTRERPSRRGYLQAHLAQRALCPHCTAAEPLLCARSCVHDVGGHRGPSVPAIQQAGPSQQRVRAHSEPGRPGLQAAHFGDQLGPPDPPPSLRSLLRAISLEQQHLDALREPAVERIAVPSVQYLRESAVFTHASAAAGGTTKAEASGPASYLTQRGLDTSQPMRAASPHGADASSASSVAEQDGRGSAAQRQLSHGASGQREALEQPAFPPVIAAQVPPSTVSGAEPASSDGLHATPISTRSSGGTSSGLRSTGSGADKTPASAESDVAAEAASALMSPSFVAALFARTVGKNDDGAGSRPSTRSSDGSASFTSERDDRRMPVLQSQPALSLVLSATAVASCDDSAALLTSTAIPVSSGLQADRRKSERAQRFETDVMPSQAPLASAGLDNGAGATDGSLAARHGGSAYTDRLSTSAAESTSDAATRMRMQPNTGSTLRLDTDGRLVAAREAREYANRVRAAYTLV